MNKKIILLLLSILIIASFLRLYQIKSAPPGLYPDEAINGNDAALALNTGQFKVFYPENNGREGLFMDIQALFLGIFRVNEPWVLRLPSAIFGILTVLGIYFLAKELFEKNQKSKIKNQNDNSKLKINEKIALFSAFLLATSFWHILFSRIGFRAIMAPFFLVWALYFFLKALRGQNFKYSVLNSVIAGIFYGLGFYSYIAYRATPLLFLLFIPFYKNKKNFWKVALIFTIVTIMVFSPLGYYFLKHPADFFGRTSELSVTNSSSPLKNLAINTLKTIGMFFIAGDNNWRQNYYGKPELFWPVALLFIIGIIIGIKNIIKNLKIKTEDNSGFGFCVLFFWLILAAAPVVLSNEGIPHALRSILMIPPVFILAGVGGVWLYGFLKKYIKSFWLPFTSLIFLSLIVFQAYYVYFILWSPNPNTAAAFSSDYVALGHELNNLPASEPKYVVVQAGGVLVNGIPMPAQTTMFITGTFTAAEQTAKNIHYVLPDEEKNIPAGALKFYVK